MNVASFLDKVKLYRRSAMRRNRTVEERNELRMNRFHRTRSQKSTGVARPSPLVSPNIAEVPPSSTTIATTVATNPTTVEMDTESHPLAPYMELAADFDEAASSPDTPPPHTSTSLPLVPDPSRCTRNPTEPSPFLSLPYEIRKMVYRFALEPLNVKGRPSDCPDRRLSENSKIEIRWREMQTYATLSRLNRQIHQEVEELVWGVEGLVLYLTEGRSRGEASDRLMTEKLMGRMRFVVVSASRSESTLNCAFLWSDGVRC